MNLELLFCVKLLYGDHPDHTLGCCVGWPPQTVLSGRIMPYGSNTGSNLHPNIWCCLSITALSSSLWRPQHHCTVCISLVPASPDSKLTRRKKTDLRRSPPAEARNSTINAAAAHHNSQLPNVPWHHSIVTVRSVDVEAKTSNRKVWYLRFWLLVVVTASSQRVDERCFNMALQWQALQCHRNMHFLPTRQVQ